MVVEPDDTATLREEKMLTAISWLFLLGYLWKTVQTRRAMALRQGRRLLAV
jgi:hypothetical protein